MRTRLKISLLGIESGAPRERALNEKRMSLKIDQKGVRGPTPNTLNFVQWGTRKCKRSSATGTKRMARDLVGWKYGADAIDEPRSSGDASIAAQPELREVRKTIVARTEVNFKEMHRIETR